MNIFLSLLFTSVVFESKVFGAGKADYGILWKESNINSYLLEKAR